MATGKREIGPVTRVLAEELRVAAARKRMTQAQVSRAAEIPPPTLSKIFRGTGAIDVEQLFALASALNDDPVRLVEAAQTAVGAAHREAKVVAFRRADELPVPGDVDPSTWDEPAAALDPGADGLIEQEQEEMEQHP